MEALKLRIIKSKVEKGLNLEIFVKRDGVLVFRRRHFILDIPELKRDVLEEAHSSKYEIRSRNTKIYWTLVK